VPMLYRRWDVDNIARSNLLDGLTPNLNAARASGDN